MNQTAIEIISIEDLSFAISAKTILENIGFSVSSGQKLYIVGPNGAGKTTLLRCLSRIVAGYQGVIKVKDKNLKSYSQKKLAKILVYLPQGLPAEIPFTVHQFVLMARYPHLSPFSVITPPMKRLSIRR